MAPGGHNLFGIGAAPPEPVFAVGQPVTLRLTAAAAASASARAAAAAASAEIARAAAAAASAAATFGSSDMTPSEKRDLVRGDPPSVSTQRPLPQ